MKRIILAALVGVLVSGPVWGAEKITIGEYIKFYDQADPKTQDFIEATIGDMGDGMNWVNTELKSNGRPISPEWLVDGGWLGHTMK